MKRKCPDCQTWNETNTHCTNCGYVLDYELRRQQEVKAFEEEQASRPPDKTTVFLDSMKHSRFFPIKAIYYLFYSVWALFAAILSGIMFFIAAGPG